MRFADIRLDINNQVKSHPINCGVFGTSTELHVLSDLIKILACLKTKINCFYNSITLFFCILKTSKNNKVRQYTLKITRGDAVALQTSERPVSEKLFLKAQAT